MDEIIQRITIKTNKMDCYYLSTLILFFRTQLDVDFECIRDILRIIDDTEIPECDKRDWIMDTLRTWGLNETSYRGGKFSPGEDKSPAEYAHEKVHYDIKYPLQAIRFQVLNGTVGVNIPLN